MSPSWYVRGDGSLDLPKLLGAFQGYFREHAESWVERNGLREAGPQLVLHVYPHRVINSGDASRGSMQSRADGQTCSSIGRCPGSCWDPMRAGTSSNARC